MAAGGTMLPDGGASLPPAPSVTVLLIWMM
jgi:hypothetical protein